MHRRRLQLELFRREQTDMPDHDHALLVYDDRLPPAKGFDAHGDLIDCFLRDDSGVLWVWFYAGKWPGFDFHRAFVGFRHQKLDSSTIIGLLCVRFPPGIPDAWHHALRR